MARCLYCYQLLKETEIDFHTKCSKQFFGEALPPYLPYTEAQMVELAKEIVRNQTAVTGVQAKLSLDLIKANDISSAKKFTIVGLRSHYILKPPSEYYPQLPEVEDLTMHLAQIAKINVVPHSLIRLQSGSLAYITKRIDRILKSKLHMEDMCQLTERLTEHKYKGSNEQIAKAIMQYSSNPGLDVINFFEQLVFSFLTGNADMHLKNYSLLRKSGNSNVLSPAYDLIATVLVNPGDPEEIALNLNGKKRKIKRSDFEQAFRILKLEEKQIDNIFSKMERARSKWMEFIEISFISEDFKKQYKELIDDRFLRLGI